MKKNFLINIFFFNIFFFAFCFSKFDFDVAAGDIVPEVYDVAPSVVQEEREERKRIQEEPIIHTVDLPVVKEKKELEVKKKPKEYRLEEKKKILSKKFLNTPIAKRKNRITEIRIATTLPLSGEFAFIGKELFAGMNLVFNKINRDGGVRGAQIKLYSYDDDFSFYKASKNIERLIKKTPVFVSLYGLNSMLALKPYLEESKALSLFAVSGSSVIRDLEYRNSIYLRPSQRKEIKKIVDYTINTRNKRDIAVFYERSQWGKAALCEVQNRLKKYDLKPVAVGFYPENTVNVYRAIDSILAGTPNAIICLSSARATYNFIRRAINKGLYKCLYLGLSDLIAAKQTLYKARGVSLVTTSVVPDPFKSNMAIVKQFRKDASKFLPTKKLSHFFLEGYINALFLVEVLKRLRPPVTPGKIIEKIEKLKRLKFKGLMLRFGLEPMTLSGNLWLEGKKVNGREE